MSSRTSTMQSVTLQQANLRCQPVTFSRQTQRRTITQCSTSETQRDTSRPPAKGAHLRSTCDSEGPLAVCETCCERNLLIVAHSGPVVCRIVFTLLCLTLSTIMQKSKCWCGKSKKVSRARQITKFVSNTLCKLSLILCTATPIAWHSL